MVKHKAKTLIPHVMVRPLVSEDKVLRLPHVYAVPVSPAERQVLRKGKRASKLKQVPGPVSVTERFF